MTNSRKNLNKDSIDNTSGLSRDKRKIPELKLAQGSLEGKIMIPISHFGKTSYIFARKSSDIKQVEALYTSKCNKLPIPIARGGQPKGINKGPNSASVDDKEEGGVVFDQEAVLSPEE